jgi:hypothetical protein
MASARQPARYEMFIVTRCRVTAKKMGAALTSAIRRHQLTSGSPSSPGAQAATTTSLHLRQVARLDVAADLQCQAGLEEFLFRMGQAEVGEYVCRCSRRRWSSSLP